MSVVFILVAEVSSVNGKVNLGVVEEKTLTAGVVVLGVPPVTGISLPLCDFSVKMRVKNLFLVNIKIKIIITSRSYVRLLPGKE